MEVILRCYDPSFKEFISITFERAGITVKDFEETNEASLQMSSVWITSDDADPSEFKTKLQADVASAEQSHDSKIIIWNRSDGADPSKVASLDRVVNEIKYKGLYNIRDHQFMRVVDDIRFILKSIENEEKSEEDWNMVLIYDSMEKEGAERINEMLSAILKVKMLEYNQFEGQAFNEQINAVLDHSDFYIIYSSKNIDWAINLHREVWRLAGGASRNVRYLVATDDMESAPDQLDVPNTGIVKVEADLLPLEIKIYYDQFEDERN